MESGPAIFAGAVFALFGGALLGWTAVRVRGRRPVALGVRQGVAAPFAAVVALAALAACAWCVTQV